jgi:hypothetical protein
MTGRRWYVVALVVFLVGAGVLGAFLWTRLGSLGEELRQMVAPGAADMLLAEPGTYTVFHETVSTFDGRIYRSGDIAGLVVAVRGGGGGTLAVRPPAASMTYSLAGREGVAIAAFDVTEPGWHRITAATEGGRQLSPFVLALGRDFGTKLAGTVLGGLGILFGTLAVAVAIASVTYMHRRRLRRPAPTVRPA